MTEIIAQRELLVKKPDGEIFNTSICFGRPYESEKNGWCCDLIMEGIDKQRYGAGIDSLQAILLTMSLAESILIARTNDGWRLYWPDKNEPMAISELFDLSSFVGDRS